MNSFDIQRLTNEYAKRMSIPLSGIKFSHKLRDCWAQARIRWDRFTRKVTGAEVTYSTMLLQLPSSCDDFVLLQIVHELTHAFSHEHGILFWCNVARYVPNGEELSHKVKVTPNRSHFIITMNSKVEYVKMR